MFFKTDLYKHYIFILHIHWMRILILPIILVLFLRIPILLKAVVLLLLATLVSTAYYTGNVLVDNKYYMNKQHSAKERVLIKSAIDTLQRRADALVRHATREHPTDTRVRRLTSKWHAHAIHELEHTAHDVFAYNVNKGDTIAVCMHDHNAKMNKINDMFFVTMHEMAHIMTYDYSHNEEFWESFKLLIKVAVDHKLFRNVNYSKTPAYFCGHYIDRNPIF